MFGFEQNQDFDDIETANTYGRCVDLQGVAAELGIDAYYAVGLDSMTLDQLKSVEALIAEAIEKAGEEAQAKLREMGRCPMGYKWRPEGHGYRCEGGQHFVTADELGL